MAKYTRRQWLTLITFAIADFCSAACVSLQAPFYPEEAEKKGATASQFGFVFGVFELVVFLSSPFYGRYLNVIGPSFLFSAGIFTTGTTCVLFGLLNRVMKTAEFVGLSFAIRIVEALGNAAFLTASFSLIAKEFPDSVGATFASLETCFGLGLIIGPTLGGGLYELGGYSLPFFTLGSLLIACALTTRLVLPPNEPLNDQRTDEQSQLLQVLKIPSILLLIYSVIATALSIGFLQAVLEPHLRPLHLSPLQTGLIFIVNGGTYAISAPLWGYLGDNWILPRRIVAFGSVLTTVAFLFVGPAPFLPMEPSLYMIIGSLLCHGIGFGAELVGSFSGCQREAITHGLPNNIGTYGVVSGIWTSTFALGAFIGPTLAGILYDIIGFRWATTVVASMHILVLISLLSQECCSCCRISKKALREERQKLLRSRSRSYGSSEDSCYCTGTEDSTSETSRDFESP